jgi:hypothetical protein
VRWSGLGHSTLFIRLCHMDMEQDMEQDMDTEQDMDQDLDTDQDLEDILINMTKETALLKSCFLLGRKRELLFIPSGPSVHQAKGG